MNKENTFLIYCSRINPDSDIKNKLKELSASGLDWDLLVKKAMRQGVAQFFYYHLSKIEEIWSVIPVGMRDNLKNIYYGLISSNWRAQIFLKDVILALDHAGVPVIVLKGHSLLDVVYKDIGLRPISDVDLLVKREDLERVKIVLGNAGYQKPCNLDKDSLEKFGAEIHLAKDDGLSLDIHSYLSQYERLRDVIRIDRDIWNHTVKHEGKDFEFQSLDPAHLIMNLCLHQVVGHFFRGLFRYCDLREAVFCYGPQINWQDFIRQVRKYKIKTIVYVAFSVNQRLFKEKLIDDCYLAAMKPPKIREALIDLLIEKDKIFNIPDDDNNLFKYLAQLLLIDSYRDVLRVLLRSLFPSRDWLIYKYNIPNKPKFCYYRLFHPFIFMNRLIRVS